MKQLLFFVLLLATATVVRAQLTAEQRIEDSVIGWWSNNKYDHLKPQTDPVGKRREEQLNQMVSWMKKSYTPVGGLGTFSRYINKETYGVLFMVWNVSHNKQWTEKDGRFKPIPEENTRFYMYANTLMGSNPIWFINKVGGKMFTLQPDGYVSGGNYMDIQRKTDLRIHPNAYPYITWINDWNTIYLAPNNKMPLVAVSKGELLQAAEEALAGVIKDEEESVKTSWPGNTKVQQEALAERVKVVEQYRVKIRQLRERHRATLNEPAVIRDMQPSMQSFELDPDIFQIDRNQQESKHYYPVYKVDPKLLAQASTDKPLWIAIAAPFRSKEQGNQEYEMYRSVTENINFGYIYDYFFNPEKVKGKPYVPANEDQLKQRLAGYRKAGSDAVAATLITGGKGKSWFADDFTGNAPGSVPANWFFNKYSEHAALKKVDGYPGNWVQLGYFNPFRPNLMRYPLPADFSVKFDLLTDGGYEGYTGGSVMLALNTRKIVNTGNENGSGKGETVTVNFVAGNDGSSANNYRGIIDIDLNSSPTKNEQHYKEGAEASIPLREFNKKDRLIKVEVTVKAGVITVLVNGKEMSSSRSYKLAYGAPCVQCGLDPASRIQAISWKSTTNDAKNIKVYISNIEVLAL